MNDRYDEEQLELPKTENPVQSLKTVAMLLKGLYKQLADERDAITLSSGEMAHAVKQFQDHLTQFAAFEKACRNYVADGVKKELRESVPAMAQELSQRVAEHATKPIHESVTHLHDMTNRLKSLYDEGRARQKRPWALIGMVFFLLSLLGGLIGGFLVHRFTPGINERINQTLFSQIYSGKTLMRAWPKLSKEEQDKIIKWGTK
jgi:cation transport ATPase